MTRINVLVLMILCVLQIHLGDVVVAVVVDEGGDEEGEKDLQLR